MPSHSLTRIHRRGRAALLTSLVALLTPAASAAEWRLWPSPYDGAETIDQSQTTSDGPGGFPSVNPGAGIGQTFVPRRTPLLRRYWGGTYGAPGENATITRFADSRNATVAWLEWDDPRGWKVRQERRLYFVKNRFLLVRDRFSFPERMEVAVGPVWHAGDLHPRHGVDWYDVYYRETLTNMCKYRNPERYALLYFVPRLGQRSSAFEEESYLPPEGCPRNDRSDTVAAECRSGPPFVIYQRWTGETTPGESRWFDTLLLPHGPELSPAEAAARVRVLLADAERVALEVKVDDETWSVVDQPQGGTIEVPGLSSDAAYAIVRSAPEQPPHLLAHAASHIEVGDLSYRWPLRTSVELGGYTPSDRPGEGARRSQEEPP